MNPDNTQLIFGPPGTGKTTELLRIVDCLMEEGYQPHEICFVAFTRKAANEAKERAMAKFNLRGEQLPLFRTLHSLAFKLLGMKRQDVMGLPDYITIARREGIYITAKGVQEDGTLIGSSKGDRLVFTEMMSRARMMSLKDYWELRPDEDLLLEEVQSLANTIKTYKQDTGKIDFIDMLDMFSRDLTIDFTHKILIVDEAQDLSPIQWNCVKLLAAYADNVYIAGDDDQAIFTWAGADVNRFIECPGSQTVLTKSYRVPVKIQEVAQGIVDQIGTRVEKRWTARKDEGVVEHINSLDQLDMSKGTWLLLGRNVFLLQQYSDYLLSAGYVFDSPLGSPTRGESLRAIVTWEKLRKGDNVSASHACHVYDMMSSKVGVAYGSKTKLEKLAENEMITLSDLTNNFGLLVTSIWHEALDRIPDVERQYFLAALKRGEKLLKEPRIKVSTIHGVKGGEAENVVLMTDMAQRTFLEFHQDPDSEHRVFFVAVTRAKNCLYIMQPKTKNYYPL